MPLKFEKPYRAMSVNNSLQIAADDSSGQSGAGKRGGIQLGLVGRLLFEMIAAMGNIHTYMYKYHVGDSAHWHLAPITCAHGIITKPAHKHKQQLQIRANIKSGNFPWHRQPTTTRTT